MQAYYGNDMIIMTSMAWLLPAYHIKQACNEQHEHDTNKGTWHDYYEHITTSKHSINIASS